MEQTIFSITVPFFQASENRLPIFLEGFLAWTLLLFTEKLMVPVRTEAHSHSQTHKKKIPNVLEHLQFLYWI